MRQAGEPARLCCVGFARQNCSLLYDEIFSSRHLFPQTLCGTLYRPLLRNASCHFPTALTPYVVCIETVLQIVNAGCLPCCRTGPPVWLPYSPYKSYPLHYKALGLFLHFATPFFQIADTFFSDC